MSRILIIEDDRALVDVLAYNLRQAGYEVDAAYDGMDGLDAGATQVAGCRGLGSDAAGHGRDRSLSTLAQ